MGGKYEVLTVDTCYQPPKLPDGIKPLHFAILHTTPSSRPLYSATAAKDLQSRRRAQNKAADLQNALVKRFIHATE